MTFCDSKQMAMTMYMDGFRSSLFSYWWSSHLTVPTAAPTAASVPTPSVERMSMYDRSSKDVLGGWIGHDTNDQDMNIYKCTDLGIDMDVRTSNANVDMDMNGAPPCLNFLSSNWTLDTPAKFVLCMVSLFLLSIVAEMVSALRSSGNLVAVLPSPKSCGGRFLRRVVILSTHMMQAAIGYVLMLAAMSYSIELFGSVVAGLGVGYCLFFDVDGDENNDENGNVGGEEGVDADGIAQRNRSSSVFRNGGAGTCCDFGGRGPPRRAFRFGLSNNGEGNDSDSDSDGDTNPIPLQGSEEYLSLEEDDKMTPLL